MSAIELATDGGMINSDIIIHSSIDTITQLVV